MAKCACKLVGRRGPLTASPLHRHRRFDRIRHRRDSHCPQRKCARTCHAGRNTRSCQARHNLGSTHSAACRPRVSRRWSRRRGRRRSRHRSRRARRVSAPSTRRRRRLQRGQRPTPRCEADGTIEPFTQRAEAGRGSQHTEHVAVRRRPRPHAGQRPLLNRVIGSTLAAADATRAMSTTRTCPATPTTTPGSRPRGPGDGSRTTGLASSSPRGAPHWVDRSRVRGDATC